jgi:CRISPR type III-B/RAMP module-associated protein Cmr5
MALRSIEQARAAFAWDCANRNRNNDRFTTIVAKIPAYIKTNGLLNTLAFLNSKNDYRPALDCIREWLVDANSVQLILANNNNEALLDHLVHVQPTDARLLIQYTAEVLALFNWLRRFTTKE